jgi:hypothetical protein
MDSEYLRLNYEKAVIACLAEHLRAYVGERPKTIEATDLPIANAQVPESLVMDMLRQLHREVHLREDKLAEFKLARKEAKPLFSDAPDEPAAPSPPKKKKKKKKASTADTAPPSTGVADVQELHTDGIDPRESTVELRDDPELEPKSAAG